MSLLSPGTDTEYKDFTHLMDIVVGFPVKEVALCQHYVAFTSKHQLHCFKLSVYNQTQEGGVALKPTTNDVVLPSRTDEESTSHGRTDQQLTSHGRIYQKSVGNELVDNGRTNQKSDSHRRSDQKSTSHGRTDTSTSLIWNFGSAGYAATEPITKPLNESSSSTILLPSVKHEKLFHEDLKHPVEMLGPKEKVKGHPVLVKWDEEFLYRYL